MARKRARTISAEERSKAKNKKKRLTKQQKQLIAAALAVAILFCFSNITKVIQLKGQQRELIKQQEELKEERDRLKAKLKNVDSAEYIAEQARKQLRMIHPDEILFVFDDEEDSATEDSQDTEAAKEDTKDTKEATNDSAND